MKWSIFLSLLLVVILLSASQCKKNKFNPYSDNGLPPATQEGKRVFACRVNGQPWISGTDIYHLGGGFLNDTIGITGSPVTEGYFENIGFSIYPPFQQGDSFNFNTPNVLGSYLTNKTCTGYTGSNTVTGFAVSGSIKISRLDKVNKIFSGLFDCVIPIPGCDTLKITDGRFDIRYH